MQRLKLFIPLAVFAALALLFWQGLKLDPNAMPSALIDRPVPPFHLVTLEDGSQKVDRSVFKGHVSLLNVWATWCVSCRVEHPYLNTLAEQGVRIVGLNYKDDVDQARKWLAEFHNPYVLSIVDADGRLGLDLGVFGAPETYVVDREGIIRFKHVGVVDERVWLRDLRPLIQQLENQ
ncbi:DsbE family thiol:disulfide interchange protein [Simiduia aestuariiviva]|uniref:Cytochrome c biogenesis protein CcmG/thiol:disulfide interchange protein DsbE n=1 Tax=Simiduia aestuariiviva TaxID=1510459 RepID=A0A839UKP2_9GAMM|nr:DsbE family thiol:disulfide interchange protein [Simiduia aestuariiviva]MBB3168694.1 cytochrome c biogenesis protein CcmG/thiol:disulfide interchange protein DsbE [Simiduia aestuariiviva]